MNQILRKHAHARLARTPQLGGKPLIAAEGREGGAALWHVVLEGEGGMDAGGLFRESFREICAELQPAAASPPPGGGLGLLVKSPNQRVGAGPGQDRWILNPRRASAEDLSMLRFLGAAIGASLRHGLSLELDLAGLEWRRLLGQTPTEADLAAADEAFGCWLAESRAAAAAGPARWKALGRVWAVPASVPQGAVAELQAGGARRAVAHCDAAEYLGACVAYRLRGEAAAQVAALREGFLSAVPGVVLRLVDWREVERLACGSPTVDIALLREHTEYGTDCGERHAVVEMLWRVLEGLDNDDRGRFLAFAWGRRRIPPQAYPNRRTVRQ